MDQERSNALITLSKHRIVYFACVKKCIITMFTSRVGLTKNLTLLTTPNLLSVKDDHVFPRGQAKSRN